MPNDIKKQRTHFRIAFPPRRNEAEKIDAFNYASTEYGVGSALKDGVKDKLKGMATLGTVRFNTVQTPKYLVLSENSLHLFDTDTEGEIDRHLVFNRPASRKLQTYRNPNGRTSKSTGPSPKQCKSIQTVFADR
ncbi:MAG: hypothetical protein ACLUDY_10750 [Bacteroides xylanisolvens]